MNHPSNPLVQDDDSLPPEQDDGNTPADEVRRGLLLFVVALVASVGLYALMPFEPGPKKGRPLRPHAF